MTTTTPDTGGANRLEERLRQDIEKTKRGQRTTLIGTVVLALIMIGYLSWLRGSLVTLLEEETLADIAAAKVRLALPRAKDMAREAMLKKIPETVDRFGEVAEAQLPQVRESFERLILRSVDVTIRQMDTKLDRAMDQTLGARVNGIRQKIRDLTEDEKIAVIEEELGAELRKVIAEANLRDPDWRMMYLVGESQASARLTVRDAIDVFSEKVQAFDAELRRIAETPAEELTRTDREKIALVCSLTAYMESLMWEEGDRILEQAFGAIESVSRQAHEEARRQMEASDPEPAEPPAESETTL